MARGKQQFKEQKVGMLALERTQVCVIKIASYDEKRENCISHLLMMLKMINSRQVKEPRLNDKNCKSFLQQTKMISTMQIIQSNPCLYTSEYRVCKKFLKWNGSNA